MSRERFLFWWTKPLRNNIYTSRETEQDQRHWGGYYLFGMCKKKNPRHVILIPFPKYDVNFGGPFDGEENLQVRYVDVILEEAKRQKKRRKEQTFDTIKK